MSPGRDPADAGHFTTVQVRGGRVQGRDWHLVRLVAASRSMYGSGPQKAVLRKRIRDAISAAGMGEADCTLRVRIVPPRAGYRGDHLAPGEHDPELRVEIDVEAPRHPPATPIRVRTHVGLRERADVKHLALGFQLEARRAAQAAGFDDALLLAPDGRISEGSFWNILFWDGAAAVWPDAAALAGITRRMLQGELERAGVPQRSEAVRPESLGAMCAAFALNTTGIADIAAVDGQAFPGDPAAAGHLRGLLGGIPWEHI